MQPASKRARALARLRLAPERSRLARVAFALALAACSRRSAELEPAATQGKSNARAAQSAPVTSLPPAKPPAPPVTPAVPPQLVACGEHDFYRISESALQVFEIARKLPPPQIRGSRIALQTNELAVEGPLSVISTAKKSALVLAKSGVFRYELGQKQARRYAPIAASAPLAAWPDPQHADAFRVHAAGEDEWRRYSLAGLPSAGTGAPPAAPQVAKVDELPGFDSRVFTVLADGAVLYSTAKGLVRAGDAATLPFPAFPGPAAALFADPSPDRYWTAHASGRLALWDRKQPAAPVAGVQLPGVVIDTALEGDRVAVLSLAVEGQSYRPTVTIFIGGKERARVTIGPMIAMRPPQLDLCVVTGRPWVVVGGTRWMQLLDWESRRLLAEW